MSALQRRAGLAALAVVVALATTPMGVIGLGMVIGCLYALLAIGLVLVYRSSRIINFAHGEVGGVAGVLAVSLNYAGVPYLIAVPAGLLTGVAIGLIIEAGVVRRFEHAPRLLLTVATIGLSQVLVFFSLIIPTWFPDRPGGSIFRTPLSRFRVTLFDVVFNGNHLLVLFFTGAVLYGLNQFFTKTTYGLAVRASAESRERAALCGVPTRNLSTLVWVLASVLSAAAFILQAPIVGLSIGAVVGPTFLLRGLTAAVVARMESLPVAVVTGIGVGVFEQSLFFSSGQSPLVDGVLVVLILVVLLGQRRGNARVDAEEANAWQAVGTVRPIPRELAALPEIQWGRSILMAVALFVVLTVPALWTGSRQGLASVIVIYALVGVSLVVLTGWAGQVSLGQFAFVGMGAAAAGTLSAEAGADFFVALTASAVVGAVVATLLGIPALRVRGFFLAVTTLGFSVMATSLVYGQDWVKPDGLVDRPVLFGRIDLHDDLYFYWFCLAVLALVMGLVKTLRSSRAGRAIVAMRDNQQGAQAFGASAVWTKLSAFAISGAIAGLAGGLLVHQQYGMQTTQYSPVESLSAFSIAVIGGLGSLPGAILGALYVKGAQYLIQGPWAILATGFGLLFLLLVLPQGLASLLFRMRDAILRAVAERRGIVVASLLADVRTDDPTVVPASGPTTASNVPVLVDVGAERAAGDDGGPRASSEVR